jgi:osmoprotectant transport system substrate-binding protein
MAASAGGANPTVRIGSTNFTEEVILAELYAQALEANGYTIDRRPNLGTRDIVEPALESSQIDIYPEYLASMLAFVTGGTQEGSSDPAETARQLQAALQPRHIAVLDYAPAADTNGFVVTRASADRYHLVKLSDLAPIAGQLVLGGAPECPGRPFCLAGLEKTYGITFRDFKPLDVGGPLTVAALAAGQIDVGLLFTTDASIAPRRFVLLEDDKGLQRSDNIAPVVRDDVLSRLPASFTTIVNGVSAQLTTQELTDLNRRVAVDHDDPKDAAGAWLRAKGLVP